MAKSTIDKTTKISIGMVLMTLVATIAIFTVSFVNRPVVATVNGFYASTEPIRLSQLNSYFNPNSNSNLKNLLEGRNAATHELDEALKAIVGESFTKQEFSGYNIKAPNRSLVKGLSMKEAIAEMKAGLASLSSEYNNGVVNPIPHEWTPFLGTGQVNWLGEDISNPNFQIKPKGLAERNTIVSFSNLVNTYTFSSCVYNHVPCGITVPSHTMPGYTWKNWYARDVSWIEFTHNPGTKVRPTNFLADDSISNADLGGFYDLPAFQKWLLGPNTTNNSPAHGTLAKGQFYNADKRYLYTEGHEDKPITHETSYFSYYVADKAQLSGPGSLNADVNDDADYVKVNFSQFDRNGTEIYKFWSHFIPMYKDGDVNDAKIYYQSMMSIIQATIWFQNGTISHNYNVSQKGDAVVYNGFKEGMAIKTSHNTWTSLEEDVNTGNMDRFSDETLAKTIEYLTGSGIINFGVESTDRYAIIRNKGDKYTADTKWMSVDEIYKEACEFTKNLVEEQHPGLWTGQCPA